MKFIVYYEMHNVEYFKIVRGGRAVERLKKRYNVFKVKRY